MPRKKKTTKKNENIGKVNCGFLNVREKPSIESASVKIIKKDDFYNIKNKKGRYVI